MPPGTAIGRLIRKRRGELGIPSAMALARKAGLSINYVSIVERGERVPRWRSAAKLADALELYGEERDEFFRVLDKTGKPTTVQAATRGLAIPGLAVWRHLPELLYALGGHELEPWHYDANDDKLRDSIPAIASLLAWVALTRDFLTDAHRIHLTERAQHIFESANDLGQSLLPSRHRSTRPEAALRAAAGLPLAWRTELLRDRKTAASLSKFLSSWEYYPGYSKPSSLSVRFNDAELEGRFGFEFIDPNLVVAVHDALTTQKLWYELKLGERFRIPDGSTILPGLIVGADEQGERGDAELRLIFDDDLRLVLDIDIAVTRKAVQESAHHYERLLNATCRLAFAERIYELPALASWLVGRPLDVLRTQRQAVEQLLDEVAQADAATFLKPAPKRARKPRKRK